MLLVLRNLQISHHFLHDFCSIDPTEKGDYEICFDNSFSRITKKSVFFEIIVDTGEDALEEDGDWKKFISPDETFGDKLATLEVWN